MTYILKNKLQQADSIIDIDSLRKRFDRCPNLYKPSDFLSLIDVISLLYNSNNGSDDSDDSTSVYYNEVPAFCGIATLLTDPNDRPYGNKLNGIYIAQTVGTYVNFDKIYVSQDDINNGLCILMPIEKSNTYKKIILEYLTLSGTVSLPDGKMIGSISNGYILDGKMTDEVIKDMFYEEYVNVNVLGNIEIFDYQEDDFVIDVKITTNTENKVVFACVGEILYKIENNQVTIPKENLFNVDIIEFAYGNSEATYENCREAYGDKIKIIHNPGIDKYDISIEYDYKTLYHSDEFQSLEENNYTQSDFILKYNKNINYCNPKIDNIIINSNTIEIYYSVGREVASLLIGLQDRKYRIFDVSEYDFNIDEYIVLGNLTPISLEYEYVTYNEHEYVSIATKKEVNAILMDYYGSITDITGSFSLIGNSDNINDLTEYKIWRSNAPYAFKIGTKIYFK